MSRNEEFKSFVPNSYVFFKQSQGMQLFFQCVISFSDYNVFIRRGGKKGLAIIYLHDLWGISPSYLRFMQHLAGDDNTIVLPDLYKEVNIETIGMAIHHMKNVKVKQLVSLINQIVEVLSVEQQIQQFSMVGFGMGGALALKLMQQKQLNVKSAISYYGLPKESEIDFEKIKYPIQIHYPRDSQVLGFSDHKTMLKIKNKIPNNKKDIIYIHQHNAQHGFIDSQDEQFDAQARKAALKKSKVFLREQASDKCLLF